jgi:hypothetical protein
MSVSRPFAERFWEKVQRQIGCWKWTGHINEHGYGRLAIGKSCAGKLILAHRASWILHYGEIPEGMLVLHQCDNPGCTNPEHLHIGTQSENMQDRQKRTWQAPGLEQHPRAQFTNTKVIEIKRLLRSGLSQTKVAAIFGCKVSAVSDISSGRCWKAIP